MRTSVAELKTRRLTVSLSEETRNRLDEMVPEGARSGFVSDAIEQALDDLARRDALEFIKSIPRVKSDKSAVETIRELRRRAEEI